MTILTKIFGDANEKYLKKLQSVIGKINSLEKEFESRAHKDLCARTQEFKERLEKGQTLDDLLPEAFALVREAAKRTLRQRHFDVQLIGGIVLHQGKIAEMKTGEGKTLTATLPLYLNALEEKGCHLVTVNDYLARRDAVWMGQIYHLLGLSVGCLNHEQSFLYDPEYKKPLAAPTGRASPNEVGREEKEKTRDELGGFYVVEDFLKPCSRKEAYLADITYGTNNEFGFDYLRDNMVYDLSQQVQRPARNASHSEAGGGFSYAIVDEVDSILIDEARTPLIISAPDTESSKWYQEFARIIPKLNPNVDYEVDEKMKAITLTEQGIDKVERILGMKDIYQEKGLRYLHYLEQALRAQGIVPSTGRSFFAKDHQYVVKDGQVIIVDEFTGRLMPGRRWSGGLHQAIEAKEGVLVQPESLTLASITFQNYFRLYKKLAGMTGTAVTSAEEFDRVYGMEVIVVPTNKPMIRKNLPDRIYKTEKGKFAAVVKEIKKKYFAGQPVLVGTTSIEKNEYLGKLLEREGIPHQILNAKHHEKEGEIIAQAGRLRTVTIATNMAGRGVDIVLGGNPPSPEGVKKVIELGGPHVIGTERHEARRIDNQLRGRTGRQGDPGSSQFFISLEDDLMRVFGGERIKSLMELLKVPEEEAIEANLVSKAIEDAQSKIEGLNFDLRKHILEYDDVLNKHREVIYRKRREFLEIEDWRSKIESLLKTTEEKKALEEKVKELGENFNSAAKLISLRILDLLWMDHLENMEYLKDSVRLRAYGQQDPLVEYKNEGHKMFQNLLSFFETSLIQNLFKVQAVSQKEALSSQQKVISSSAGQSIFSGKKEKISRNDPCPCGSGKKYKKCHGK